MTDGTQDSATEAIARRALLTSLGGATVRATHRVLIGRAWRSGAAAITTIAEGALKASRDEKALDAKSGESTTQEGT